MSITLKERKPKPADRGIPCELCIRMERLRQLINKAQLYLDKQFIADRSIFIASKANLEKATTEARARWDLMKDGDKKGRKIENLIKSKLNQMWREKQRKIEQVMLRGKRLERLRKVLSELSDAHPKCPGCGICYGEYHLESPNPTPIGNLCSNCLRLYKKYGAAYFRKLAEREEEL